MAKKITFKSIIKPLPISKPLNFLKPLTNKVANISKPLSISAITSLAQKPINNIAPVYTMAHKKKINFGSVMKEIRKDTKPLGKVLNKIISQPGDMMKLGAGTLTSLGGSLAMPLAICGVAVVIYLVTKK